MEPEPLPQPVELPEEGRLYQNVGGDFFRIICCAMSSEDRRTWNVVFRSVTRGTNWTRSLEKFNELVVWRDGTRRPRYMPAAGLPAELKVVDPGAAVSAAGYEHAAAWE